MITTLHILTFFFSAVAVALLVEIICRYRKHK
jgi:hypothetical protein